MSAHPDGAALASAVLGLAVMLACVVGVERAGPWFRRAPLAVAAPLVLAVAVVAATAAVAFVFGLAVLSL